MKEKNYDLIEVFKITGIRVRTLREWIRNGKLKAFKYVGGRKWFISEEEIKRIKGEK